MPPILTTFSDLEDQLCCFKPF